MRFLTPVLFGCAAAYVSWSNGQHTDRVLVLPFLEAVDSSLVGDPAAQGAATVKVLAALAVAFAVWECLRLLRRPKTEAEG